MSKEWLQKTLMTLGFTETDANVYIHLAKEGPKKSSEIAKALKLYNQRIYRTLKKMHNKGLVKTSHENPSVFSAVPLDKVLDLFIRANIDEAKHVIQYREELLSSWRVMVRKSSVDS